MDQHQHQTAITAGFVILGLHRVGFDKIAHAYADCGGLYELVDAAMAWVPAIDALRDAADSLELEHPYVFEYMVTQEFGAWLGDSIIDDNDLPERGHTMNILVDLVESFFKPETQDDPDLRRRLRARLDAAADTFMAKQANGRQPS